MKILRLALVGWLLAFSSASASSFYFGVRLDAPVLLERGD